MSDKTFGESAFETLSKGYRSLVGAEDLPLDKRIYMESVIDRRKDPITEKSLTAEEREQLRSLITSRYERIKPQLKQSIVNMRQNAAASLKEAAAARTPGMKAAWLKSYKDITAQMKGVQEYLDTGRLNPIVVDYARVEGVPANIQREDYENPDEINADTGNSLRSPGKDTRIGQTLGRFNYKVDNSGNLIIEDQYDFGPGAAGLLGTPNHRKIPISVGDLITPKKAAAKLAYKRLPEGKGRPVQIRINSAAPPPKPAQNWFSRAANFFGF